MTEVHERTRLPGYAVHLSEDAMAPGRRWAAIASGLPMASSPYPVVPTAEVPHRIDGVLSTDHVVETTLE